MRSRFALVAVLLLSTACGGGAGAARSSPAEPAGDDQRARRELEACLQQARADGVPVPALIDGAGNAGLGAVRQAELLDCRARVAFWRLDYEAVGLAEANVRSWESLPGHTDRLVHSLNFHGQCLAAFHVDMAAAERQFRRALALADTTQADPSERGDALFYLYDLLDQECRSEEADTVLTRLEEVYRERPKEAQAFPGVTQRFRAMLARRRGQLEPATTILNELLSSLDATKTESAYFDSLFELIAEYQRDAGNYAEALRTTELRLTYGSSSQERIFDLAFAYEAAGDPRLGELEQQASLGHSRAGQQLFPSKLRAVEACQAESLSAPVGWFYRDPGTRELTDRCFVELKRPHHEKASLRLVMRIDEGKVVASGVRGQAVDEAVLRCVAEGALGLAYPAPHDFNFREETY